jgi:predicted permease
VLLVGAALLGRGFMRLQAVDAGFSPHGVLTFKVALSGPKYRTPDVAHAFGRALREKLSTLPGVVATGAISHLPYDEVPNWGGPYLPEGKTDRNEARVADTRAVMPGYFEAVGATLIDGRLFSEADTARAQPVAIVDQRLAERTWPGQSAIGKRILADPSTSGDANTMVTVIGVIEHIRHRRPTEETNEQIYFPWTQAFRNPMAYVVRAGGDPSTLSAAVRDAVRSLDPQLPVAALRPMTSYVDNARAVRRFTALLAASFAAVALLLSCIGVYGVTSYAVALRRPEFGIRVALGARRTEVMRLVFREAVGLVAIGGVIGAIASVAAAHMMRTQLYGITPWDPVSYAVALPTIAAAALAACWIPARRATSINALDAIRG